MSIKAPHSMRGPPPPPRELVLWFIGWLSVPMNLYCSVRLNVPLCSSMGMEGGGFQATYLKGNHDSHPRWLLIAQASLIDWLMGRTFMWSQWGFLRAFAWFCMDTLWFVLLSGGRSVHITDGEETLQIWQQPELDGWRRLLHLSRVWHLYASWAWRRRDPRLSSDSPPVLGIVIIFLCIWLCTQGLMHSARHMGLNLRVMEWLML